MAKKKRVLILPDIVWNRIKRLAKAEDRTLTAQLQRLVEESLPAEERRAGIQAGKPLSTSGPSRRTRRSSS